MTLHNARYGWPHRRYRAHWKRAVEAGLVLCWRCERQILPWERWDLGHVDGGGPREYSGPEHSKCNRQAGAAQGNRARVEQPRVCSREW